MRRIFKKKRGAYVAGLLIFPRWRGKMGERIGRLRRGKVAALP
jgi:hypothetical protein